MPQKKMEDSINIHPKFGYNAPCEKNWLREEDRLRVFPRPQVVPYCLSIHSPKNLVGIEVAKNAT